MCINSYDDYYGGSFAKINHRSVLIRSQAVEMKTMLNAPQKSYRKETKQNFNI